ncbi:mitochondrial carrier [Trichodelitschia bisporula]|uniref:Mitochondrial carrier n=1 Tax=Trichodelitschia bisporula TaxID=703511 RepID=A0A6G1HYU5_9PEZI|nr:mitochondrial carrier [Trichodelitschia bisporula]
MPGDSQANTDILLAGAAAALTVDLLVYPLDTLKTRLQSKDYARLYLNASTNTINKPTLFRGLYQGVGSVVIATLPSSGAFFTAYESLNHTFAPLPLPTPLRHALSSALAELVSCAILTPAEVLKQNAQMLDGTKGRSTTLATLSHFRSRPFALWHGYTALAARNLPFTALQFPLFERLRQMIWDSRERTGHSRAQAPLYERGAVTAVSAGLAGSVAAVITTPVDVVKTRVMLAAAEEQGHGKVVDAMGAAVGKRKRLSGWQVGREIWAESGVKGLWRGGLLRGVWTMLGSGLYLGAYESGRVYLGRRRGETKEDVL